MYKKVLCTFSNVVVFKKNMYSKQFELFFVKFGYIRLILLGKMVKFVYHYLTLSFKEKQTI